MLFDRLAALLSLTLLSPCLLCLAALVKIDSIGPVLYRQKRIGRGGREFEILKLRTMSAMGEVTRVGRWLRRSGLDELPQLLNVCRGEMSLVGPRPLALDEHEECRARFEGFEARYEVNPGVTGWAQLHEIGEPATDAWRRRRHERDLEYLKKRSAWLDVKILFLTPFALWRGARRARRPSPPPGRRRCTA